MIKKFTGLRLKLMILVAVAMLLLFAFLFFAAKVKLLQGYAQLEQDKTRIQVSSAESLLKEQVDQLSTITRDYARWNDTYNFIKTRDPSYIQSNLVDTTFSNLKINALVIVNLKGEVVFRKGLDFRTGQLWQVPAALEEVGRNKALTSMPQDHVAGLFWTAEGAQVVSVFDVVDSDAIKARRGTLMMVRSLDISLLTHIGHMLGAKTDVLPYHQHRELAKLTQLMSKKSIAINVLDDHHIAGYKMLDSLGDAEQLVLRVQDEREIFEQGHTSVNFLYGSAGLVALLLVAFGWLIDKWVLKRLSHLNQHVTSIGSSASAAGRVQGLTGRDEIASLGYGINHMLARLEESQLALALEKNRSQVTLSTLSSIADAVIACDHLEQITYMNAAAEQLSGVSAEDAKGKKLAFAFQLTLADHLTHIDSNWLIDATSKLQEATLMRTDGKMFVISKSTSHLNDNQGVFFGTVTVIHDLTSVRALSDQLSYQASHDALTGLLNRYEFDRKAQATIQSAHAENQTHALAYMDFDQFKIVNDTCGHMAGDMLLKEISHQLKAKMRSADTLARLGGDEFAILLMNCNLAHAQLILGDILSYITEYRFNYDDKVFKVGASIGLTEISPHQALSLNELFAIADTACYQAKHSGGNRIHTYIPQDEELKARSDQFEWVSRINLGLEQDHFVLYMQRIQNLTGTERHCEILVRMKGAGNQLYAPGYFLPVAERYNLMPRIDRWVLTKALSVIASKGKSFPYVCAINLSGQTLSDDSFLDYVLGEIKQYQVNPKQICFEITETAVISRLDKARHFIKVLRAIGCRFSLDDFGSGLSSFGYLKNLEVDFLKIDGMFVKSILENKIDRAMVESINNIGHVMQLKTIAEFAENEQVIQMLKTIGVDFVQGYGVSMPEPFGAELEQEAA